MLNNHERVVLDELEERLRSEDPRFATRFHEGQRRLPAHSRGPARRFRPMTVATLAALAIGLFVLGVPGAALLLAVVAAATGWLGTVHITSGGDNR